MYRLFSATLLKDPAALYNKRNHISAREPINNMASRRRIPEETKASIQALKATTNLTLTEIAECCKVSTASVQRIITAKDKAPGKIEICAVERESLLLIMRHWFLEALQN